MYSGLNEINESIAFYGFAMSKQHEKVRIIVDQVGLMSLKADKIYLYPLSGPLRVGIRKTHQCCFISLA